MCCPCVIATQRYQKCRRRDYVFANTNFTTSGTSPFALMITILLAALAVVARGESRTLRHHRQDRFGASTDAVRALLSSTIVKQQLLQESKDVNIWNDNGRRHDSYGENTITSSLSRASNDRELEETYQHSSSQHSISETQPSHKSKNSRERNSREQNSRKRASSPSIQNIDLGRKNDSKMIENNFMDGTIDHFDHTIIQTEGAEKQYQSGPILLNLFSDPKERDAHYDYGIGNGEEKESYDKQQSTPTQVPFSDPNQKDDMSDTSVCIIPDFQCCSNLDCIHSDDLCVNRNCIVDGYFRFTLAWIGDDDYDLFVITPDGFEINYDNRFDPVSLGKLETEVDQDGYGYHVENVYFPLEGAPSGVYRFYVRPFMTLGENDAWTVTVMEAGSRIVSESGVGSSEFFYCKKEEHNLTKYPTIAPIPSPLTPTSPTTIPQTPTLPTISPMGYPIRPPLGQPTIRPGSVPSSPPNFSIGPSSLDDCNTAKIDECCLSTDCTNMQEICEHRTCINAGGLRFTLLWTGYKNLDLFVITPDGVRIDRNNTFDSLSGGQYEDDTHGEATYEYRVQNIFFQTENLQTGFYLYGVRSNAETDSDSLWKIQVHDMNDLIESHTGSRNSETFKYFRTNAIDEPQRPKPEPPECSTAEEECCIDSDCADSTGDLCVQRTCINNGPLRISLEWIGDDNLRLFVKTPSNVFISKETDSDLESGGRHESSEQSTFGFNVENVYFPASGAQAGIYEISIDAFHINGLGPDKWTMRIYEDGEMKVEESGFGDSIIYYYDVSPAKPTLNPQTDLCDIDSCWDDTQVCVEGGCIREGNPRITLRWPGGNFYGLTVVAPNGKHVSANCPFDEDSGGVFTGLTQQLTEGNDVESVSFPIEGGALGLYTYFVTNSGGGDYNETWIVDAYVNGANVATHTGSGNSDMFSFQFRGSSLHPQDSPNKPQPSACDTTLDCLLLNTICVKQICIEKGTPQFVLSWDSSSDISLVVATPLQTTLSSKNIFDAASGGRFRSYDALNDSNSHVQNIYFTPEQGPVGLYPFYVHSYDDKGDTWILTIFVDGEEVHSYDGQGTSDILLFNFSGNQPVEEPPTIAPPYQGECDPDCLFNEICVENMCVEKGSPQFLLTWEGDYDVALFVVTPAETVISWQYPLDPESGGEFNEIFDDEDFRRFENIHFSEGTFGLYAYYIHSFGTFNDDDTWTLAIYVDGQKIITKTGQGSSEVLFFDYSDNLPTNHPIPSRNPTIIPVPTMNPTTSLVPSLLQETKPPDDEICDPLVLLEGKCCSNTDCFPNEACASRTCVDEGNPRFTLSWRGTNDLDLFVVTPLETVVSYSTEEDPLSGGKFGEEYDQFEYGLHVENIYFPRDGGPIGEYSFYVRKFLNGGVEDEWTVDVYVDGAKQISVSGTGSSEKLTYTFSPV